MAAQKHEPKRNYIGLVDDAGDGQRTTTSQSHASRPIRDYLRGLVAALLETRNDAS